MKIEPARFQKLLDEFNLLQLFNELGWDHASLRPQEISVNGEPFTLTALAQKRGVTVFRCSPDASENIPPRPTLLKIEKEATKLAHEHLLVFGDAAQSTLTWLWVSRIPGQPAATRTHTWHRGVSGEALRQKLDAIVWSLEQEEAITLTDVITGLRRAFDRDKVSKSFYDKFKAEHEAFADFIAGVSAVTDKAWYASLMLNRLMFVYFIQRKGFLDGNQNYLADRMQRVRNEAGEGHFHSFYRQFLRRLFHDGLGKPARDADLTRLIGDVPYLNGGLFAVHELEEANPDIDIPDEAFERLFRFFDAYDWHLDDRPLAKGNEINPDVLGYIFEKYINQKQMGAYYTKEDITEYIAKNTVIPHLLEQARERCKVAFDGEASVWNLLKADPDRYLYPAMKTGVIDASGQIVPESTLPDFVQTGVKDPKARMFDKRYNLGEAVFHTASGERGTLPTETWREYVERRTRCLSVREKLASGEIKSADDLITLNLDIRQFMQDVIDTCAGPDLLRAVWQAIVGRVPEKANEKFRHGIAILDPTCGSGAFLFAALNVLEPLYEACLDRMEGFVEDARRLPSPSGRWAGGEGKPGEGANHPLSPGERGRGEGAPRYRDIPEETLCFARELRRQQTDAENLVWMLLRDRRLGGYKFRRQHPVAPYILDFYCHEAKLAVELDGGQHGERRQQDEKRDAFLAQQGIQVLRLWNNQVLGETEAMLEAIWRALQSRTPSPLAPLPEGEGKKVHPPFADFTKVLDEVGRHPSRRYFIYKSIILHNLFGVDIMAEAVEICKLRLFLKLVSQVDIGRELEPLPDIDFNIRCGNTLVGYATEAQFDAIGSGNIEFGEQQDHKRAIKADIADLADLFDRFREQQTVHGGKITADDKRKLRDKLNGLSLELDRYLARDYGTDPDQILPSPSGTNPPGADLVGRSPPGGFRAGTPGNTGAGGEGAPTKAEARASFAAWRESHQPFHWFAEFYGVMREGGFDVVIGNPPYIQLKEIGEYQLRGYACTDCGNVYPVVLERCLSLCAQGGRQGYIVPVSSISTDGYSSLQEQYRSKRVHVSCYDDRPSRLFDGLEHIRLVIFLLSNNKPAWFSTRYHKWNSQERESLFERLSYVAAREGIVKNSVPKLAAPLELSILSKLAAISMTVGGRSVRTGPHSINFSRKVGYFLQVVDFQPRVVDGAGNVRPPSEFKPLIFSSSAQKLSALALLNSNLFYWFMTVFSDCRHLNKREVDAMPFPDVLHTQADLATRLKQHADELMANLRVTADTRTMRFRHDRLEIECIIPKRSKRFLDTIDLDVANGFGFSAKETDFIINYDIKYRMGGADSDE